VSFRRGPRPESVVEGLSSCIACTGSSQAARRLKRRIQTRPMIERVVSFRAQQAAVRRPRPDPLRGPAASRAFRSLPIEAFPT